MRTSVYIDAFNLYYGCAKGTPYRWLDVGKLCSLLLRGHTITRIRYFTALVGPRPGDPDKRFRQQTYIRALETIPGLSVHYGHFLSGPERMLVANPLPGGPRTVEVVRTQEKGSDVNLATYLLPAHPQGRGRGEPVSRGGNRREEPHDHQATEMVTAGLGLSSPQDCWTQTVVVAIGMGPIGSRHHRHGGGHPTLGRPRRRPPRRRVGRRSRLGCV